MVREGFPTVNLLDGGATGSLAVGNLFNQRQGVTDRAGATPLRFQPAYRDPLGRNVTIEFRRSF